MFYGYCVFEIILDVVVLLNYIGFFLLLDLVNVWNLL